MGIRGKLEFSAFVAGFLIKAGIVTEKAVFGEEGKMNLTLGIMGLHFRAENWARDVGLVGLRAAQREAIVKKKIQNKTEKEIFREEEAPEN